MNWVSPIKDATTLQNFKNSLKEYDIKYYIMFEIGIGTGMLLQDILKLKVGDIRGKEQITVSIGTKNIQTVFHIPPDLQDVIRSFIADKDDGEYLIQGYANAGTALTREQAYRVFKAAGRSIGLNSIGAQTMRKTFAWNYYKRTGDIYYLQNLFKHASPSITYRYIGEKPNIGIVLKKMTPEENERCWKSLKLDGNGIRRIDQLQSFLADIRQKIASEDASIEFYGQADCLISEFEELAEEFQKLQS